MTDDFPSEPLLPIKKTSVGFWILNLPHTVKPDYDFERAIQGLDYTDIQTELLINWSAASGLRIYPEFTDIHVAKRELPYYPDLPLCCGWDWGVEPACLISQVNPMGQWTIFPSFAPEAQDFDGLYAFAERIADHMLRTYAAPHGRSLEQLETYHVGDPAGRAMARHSAGGRTARELQSCFQVLNRGITLHLGEDEDGRDTGERLPGWGWIVHPGEVSHLKRQEAIRGRLRTLLRGGLPAMLVDPREEFFASCMLGGYHRKQFSDGTFDRWPMKNHASHLVNAAEYLASRLFSRPGRPQNDDDDEDARPRREPFRSQSSTYHRI